MKDSCTEKWKINEELKALLNGKISVLTGQSGAGKSTLLNTLDPSFKLATQEISKALGRGKHTTRHNELQLMPDQHLLHLDESNDSFWVVFFQLYKYHHEY